MIELREFNISRYKKYKEDDAFLENRKYKRKKQNLKIRTKSKIFFRTKFVCIRFCMGWRKRKSAVIEFLVVPKFAQKPQKQ